MDEKDLIKNDGESSEEKTPGNNEKPSKNAKKPPKKRRLWLWIILAIMLTLTLGGYGFYEYSNTPGFCNSCHIMEPYYNAWHESKHGHIACVKCHIAPKEGAKWEAKIQGMLQALKYISRSYASKPYAEIEDEACLRSGCHGERLVIDHSTETFKNNVTFDHAPHLSEVRRGRQLRCTSCHAQIVVGNHMEVTTTTCYLCHFKASDKHDIAAMSDCRICHKSLPDHDIEHNVLDPLDGTTVISSVSFNHADFIGDRDVDCRSCHQNAIVGEGKAQVDRCYVCHNEPEIIERIDDLDFIHDNHITEHNVTCERCHDQIKHEVQTVSMSMEQRCNQCHVSTHGGHRSMYMGVGGKGSEEAEPGPMYAAMVDCTGCHVGHKLSDPSNTHFQEFTKVMNKEGCERCHGDMAQDYIEVYDELVQEVKDRLAEVTSKYTRVKNNMTRIKDSELIKAFDDAEYNIQYINKARGWAHNWDYSNTLLDYAEEKLDEILER